jgi:TonB family protein
MHHKVTGILIVTILALCSASAAAQPRRSWTKFSPSGERFTVSLPRSVKVEDAGGRYGALVVKGKKYSASANGITYVVWSLKEVSDDLAFKDLDDLIDAYVDLTWESLLKPYRDQPSSDEQCLARMTYHPQSIVAPFLDRDYLLHLGDRPDGFVRFTGEGGRAYVLLVLNAGLAATNTKIFLKSFNPHTLVLGASLPIPSVIIDPRMGTMVPETPPRKGWRVVKPEYDGLFRAVDTTTKADVFYRPEPSYTDKARQYGVEGTVALEAVLSRNGQVEDISPARGLPHGLTRAAIEAARRIKFTPATKDGHRVSQFIRLEYTFNL